jgi:hypothetical protein
MHFPTKFAALALSVSAVAAHAQSSAPTGLTAPIPSVISIEPMVTPAGASTYSSDSFDSLRSVDRATTDSAVTQSESANRGAPLTGLRAGVHARESARPLQVTAAPAHGNLGQSRAMMVVGVAGLLAGAIIGGTPGNLIMVGGAVVGLIGLYDYLQ